MNNNTKQRIKKLSTQLATATGESPAGIEWMIHQAIQTTPADNALKLLKEIVKYDHTR